MSYIRVSSKSFYEVIYFPRNTSFRSRTKEGVRLPGMQTQRKVPGSSRQEPSFWQGWDSHSFTFVSHLGPVNPCVQLQANEPGVFTQIPSCSQGDPGTNKISFSFFLFSTIVENKSNAYPTDNQPLPV